MRLAKWSTSLLVASLVLAQPAGAAKVDVLEILGHGAILPGLTPLARAQAINFFADAVVVGTDSGAWPSCAFAGQGLADDYAEGTGTLGGACGNLDLPLCVYVRSGVTLTLTCPKEGGTGEALHGWFLFTPDQLPSAANPTPVVTSYHMQGDALYLDAP
jgi:hypothetical protein